MATLALLYHLLVPAPTHTKVTDYVVNAIQNHTQAQTVDTKECNQW